MFDVVFGVFWKGQAIMVLQCAVVKTVRFSGDTQNKYADKKSGGVK